MSIIDKLNNALSKIPRISNLISLAAIAVGTVVALLASTQSIKLSDDVIAMVNETPISREMYQNHIAALSRDRATPLAETGRQKVLNRMIDEELLIQQALQMQFLEHDRAVRSTLAQSMIKNVISESRARPVSKTDLKRFYRDEKAFFAPVSQIWVKQIRLPIGDDRAAADKKAIKIINLIKNGASFKETKQKYHVPAVAEIPEALLPLAKLRDYVGPELLAFIIRQIEGTLSKPFEYNLALHLFYIYDMKKGEAPPFARVEGLVRNEFMKRRDDQALKEYLSKLRRKNRIVINWQ